MALALTYDDTLSRVRISATGLGAAATATIERSLDQIIWTTVRGGQSATVTAGAVNLDDYEFAAGVLNYYRVTPNVGAATTATIIPVLTAVWIKSIGRPFLNRLVECTDVGEITRPARGGVFDVVGRSMPVAVSDVRGSRRFTLQIATGTAATCGDNLTPDEDAENLELLLASGDPVFIQAPPGDVVPTLYAAVGDVTWTRAIRGSLKRIWQVPLTEVAAPGADIVGATATWQTVLSTYGTWQDVLNAQPTWADVLNMVAAPSEVIVP
jgi:hypothetical protein